MPEVKLNADAAELAEMLQFLSEWLARDPRPAQSVRDTATHGGSGIDGGGLSYSPAA